MSDINNILPSYLDKAGAKEKKAFFSVLLHLSSVDGHADENEVKFIQQAAEKQGVKNLSSLHYEDENEVLETATAIKDRHLALELIREMCLLSHIDNNLSDEETLFIGRLGIKLGIEMEKIEQISNWIIDKIIWMEQAKIIFEEK